MAIPTSIKTLLSGDVVEWARIEFKETWDAAASLKSICAFANDLDNWGGGYIVIGVQEDAGRPVYPLRGVPSDKVDYYQKNIFARCKLLRPAYTPIIGIETYQDKQFIVIWCPGGDNRPYSSPKTMEKDNKERVHYIRKASNTVEPSDDESSPNLCVHSSSSYVSPSMLPLSSGDLIEWSLVCHSTLSYQKFCDRHSNHYDHPEELHQSVE